MRFVLKAIGPGGEVEAIDFHAPDERTAVQSIEGRGYTVLSVRKRTGLLGSKASRFPLVLFSQELRALLAAGLPLVESMDSLAQKERSQEWRAVLEGISLMTAASNQAVAAQAVVDAAVANGMAPADLLEIEAIYDGCGYAVTLPPLDTTSRKSPLTICRT